MSKGATIPCGVELQPFMRPGQIKVEESLIGLIARLTAENFLGTTQLVLKGCGVDVRYPGWIASLATVGELGDLAGILRVDHAELHLLAWKAVAESHSGNVVTWGKRTMRLRDLEARLRLISPSTLERQLHHRSSWMIKLLPYCPISFEELISACPKCGRNLRWTTARGIAKCEASNGCENGRMGIGPTGILLPQPLRTGYRKFATLISSDEAICAAARSDLHPGIAALSNPSLIDLVFNLGRIERSRDERMHAYCTLPDGNLKAAQQIARGMKFVEDWPRSMKGLGDEALNERAINRYKLDRLKRLPLHLKDDELTALLREAIPVVFLGRRTALVDGASPIMLGSHLKKSSGLTAAHIHQIVGAGLLEANVVNWGKRNQVQFDEALATEFVEARRGSATYPKVVDTLHLPEYAVRQLSGSGLLKKVENATIELLHPDGRIWLTSLEKLIDDLKAATRPRPEKADLISLSAASRIFGGGPKPWAAILETLLSGEVESYLNQDEEIATIRSLTIARDSVQKLKLKSVGFEQSSNLPAQISKRDLEDLLNISTEVVTSLEAHDVVVFEKRGRQLSTDFKASVALAAERIFRAEAAMICNLSRSVVDRIANDNGVDELPGGGWSRVIMEPLLRSMPPRG